MEGQPQPFIGPQVPQHPQMLQQGGGGAFPKAVSKWYKLRKMLEDEAKRANIELSAELQAQKVEIDNEARSITEDVRWIANEQLSIDRLKQLNPQDPQIPLREGILGNRRTSFNVRSRVFGSGKTFWKQAVERSLLPADKQPVAATVTQNQEQLGIGRLTVAQRKREQDWIANESRAISRETECHDAEARAIQEMIQRVPYNPKIAIRERVLRKRRCALGQRVEELGRRKQGLKTSSTSPCPTPCPTPSMRPSRGAPTAPTIIAAPVYYSSLSYPGTIDAAQPQRAIPDTFSNIAAPKVQFQSQSTFNPAHPPTTSTAPFQAQSQQPVAIPAPPAKAQDWSASTAAQLEALYARKPPGQYGWDSPTLTRDYGDLLDDRQKQVRDERRRVLHAIMNTPLAPQGTDVEMEGL